MKRSQVTIYIILGIVVIALLSLVLLFKSKTTENTNTGSQGETISGGLNQQYMNSLIQKCTESTLIEGEKIYGINLLTSSPLIKRYMEAAIPGCVNHFKSFKDEGFSVEEGTISVFLTLGKESVIADVNYPVVIKKAGNTLTFESFSYTFPRLVTAKLNFDKPTHIVSSDGEMVIDIPAGTKAYLDGNEINEIGIKIMDRNFNGLSNSVLAGMMAYNGWPHGTQFSQPVTMTYYYNERDIPPFIKEENLKVGYYHDDLGIWIGLNTTVDPVQNTLTIRTDHFSIYGTVINCDGTKDPITQIVTPVLVQEACGPCDESDGKKWIIEKKDTVFGAFKNVGGDKTTVEDAVKNKKMPFTCDNFETVKIPPDKQVSFTDTVSSRNPFAPTSKKWDQCGVTKCSVENYFYWYERVDTSIQNSQKLTRRADMQDNDAVLISLIKQEIIAPKDGTTVTGDSTTVKEFVIKKPNFFLLTTENGCATNCESKGGTCTVIGNTDATAPNGEVAICTITTFRYENLENLKGRSYYKIYFPASGDTCFAGPGEGAGTELSDTLDLGLGTGTGGADTGDKHPPKPVSYKYTTGKKTSLDFTIYPLCYETDECKVFLPGEEDSINFKALLPEKVDINEDGIKEEVLALTFYVETYNKGKDPATAPDACLMASARIEFGGTAPKGDYNLLCNKESLGIYDLVKGKCSICMEKTMTISGSPTKVYYWKEDKTSAACMSTKDGYCVPSLIGRKYYLDGDCYECTLPTHSLPGDKPYGVLVKVDNSDCSECGETPQAGSTT